MSIYQFLYPYQKRIVDRYKDRASWGLFTDMGTGKTPMSLGLAEANHCDRLVIITLNAKALEKSTNEGSWKWWAEKYYYELEFYDKCSTVFGQNPSCFIINYESLFERGKNKTQRVTLKHSLEAYIRNCERHNVALIIDESHNIKNLQSQRTTAVMKIKQLLQLKANVCKTYLLTGTPFTQGYIDLYAQLKVLGCQMTKSQFIDEYCIRGNVPGLLGWQQPIVGYRNINSLFNLLHRYAITIKSEEVLKLPEQVFTYVKVPQSDDIIAFSAERLSLQKIVDTCERHGLDFAKTTLLDGTTINDALLQNRGNLKKKFNNPFYRNIDYPNYDWVAETSGQMWLRARELSIGFNGNTTMCKWYDTTRLSALKRLLEQNEENYVLFYNYTPEMLEIYDICESLGYNIDVYCGEIKSLANYERFCKLDESEKLVTKKNIIIANFSSGSTGMNWQQYYHCIIFSLPVFRDWAQGIKRVHRAGQKHTVFYHIFVQQNWLDEGMYKALTQAREYDENMFKSDLARLNAILEANDD